MTTENRDPYKCKSCGTVNAWNQPVCRTCGTERNTEPLDNNESTAENHEEPFQASMPSDTAEPLPVETVPPSRMPLPRRRWNAFWIFLGIAVHVVCVHLGVYLFIIKVFIEPDAQMTTVLEGIIEAAKTGDAEKATFLESLPPSVQSKLSSIRLVLIFLLSVVPLMIGAIIGYFSRAVLEGAASMGLSAVLIPVFNNVAGFAILWGPLNAGIGALGAYIGCKLAIRFKPATFSPKA
jgi:Na+/melibiose symporter-like transporter